MKFLTFITNNLLVGTIAYKNGAILVSSLGLATIIDIFSNGFKIPDSFFGISLGLICVLSALIMLDNFTGIIASRHEGKRIKSGKLFYTFLKFLTAFLFFWLLDEIQSKLHVKVLFSDGYLQTFYKGVKESLEIVTYTIFILLSLREWISIGENIERRFGKKFYLFQIVEKIFDIVESRFIKWLENKEICKNKE